VRHPRDASRRAALRHLQSRAARIARRRQLTLAWEQTQDDNSVACSRDLTRLLAQSVRAQQGRCVELTSGAGHDAVTMATMASIAMLFVRCRGGLSHHADEYVAPADIAMALRVLVDFLERLAATVP
jgi:allantoate deiminase